MNAFDYLWHKTHKIYAASIYTLDVAKIGTGALTIFLDHRT